MAHRNFNERRQRVAELARSLPVFEPPVLRELSAEFGCSLGTIRNDLRVVAADSALRARIDSLWRSLRFR
jgi:DeoR/GlpR family transcriptional regulator of sugar metabolism